MVGGDEKQINKKRNQSLPARLGKEMAERSE